MSDYSIPEIARKLYDLLEPLESEDRMKAVTGCMAMLGETMPSRRPSSVEDVSKEEGWPFERKATRWIQQNGLTREHLDEVFHFHEDGSVEVLEINIPGNSKRAKTINAYMLFGAASLLASDEPTMTEKDVVALCKRVGCHDTANHAGTRDMLGNKTTGSKQTGFTLTVPGQKEAAEIIKQVSTE